MENNIFHHLFYYRQRVPRINRARLFRSFKEIFIKNDIIIDDTPIVSIFAELLILAVRENRNSFDNEGIVLLKKWWFEVFPEMEHSSHPSSYFRIGGIEERKIDILFAEILKKGCMKDLCDIVALESFVTCFQDIYQPPPFSDPGSMTHTMQSYQLCGFIYPRGRQIRY